MLTSKLSKYVLIIGFFLLLMFGVWMAFEYHSNVVAENGRLQAEAAEKDLALRVSIETSVAKDHVIQRWKQSAEKLERILSSQREAVEQAQRETRLLNESISKAKLEAISRADPSAAERSVNEHTLYLQCLHVCATTPGGCDCIRPGTTPNTPNASISSSCGPDTLRLECRSAGRNQQHRRGSVLSDSRTIRNTGSQPIGTSPLGTRRHVAVGILS